MEMNVVAMLDPASAANANTGSAPSVLTQPAAGETEMFAALFAKATAASEELHFAVANLQQERVESPPVRNPLFQNGNAEAIAELASVIALPATQNIVCGESGAESLELAKLVLSESDSLVAEPIRSYELEAMQLAQMVAMPPPVSIRPPAEARTEAPEGGSANEHLTASVAAAAATSALKEPSFAEVVVSADQQNSAEPSAATTALLTPTVKPVQGLDKQNQQAEAVITSIDSDKKTVGKTLENIVLGAQSGQAVEAAPVAPKKTAAVSNGSHLMAATDEVASSREPVKAVTAIPRDVAIEVALAEPVVQGGTAAETGQGFAEGRADQGAMPPQVMMHAVSNAKLAVPHAETVALQTVQPVDHESVLDQIKSHLVVPELKSEGNQIRLQLHPADLGDVQITLRMDDQKLRVEILVDNKAVKTALLEHADTLKEVLAKQNIAVERFDVGTGNNDNSGKFFREGNRPDEQQRPLNKFSAGSGFRTNLAKEQVMAAWQPRSNALLDVRF